MSPPANRSGKSWSPGRNSWDDRVGQGTVSFCQSWSAGKMRHKSRVSSRGSCGMCGSPNCSRGALTCVGCCLSLSHAHTSCNSTKILHSRRTVAKKKMLDFWWGIPLDLYLKETMRAPAPSKHNPTPVCRTATAPSTIALLHFSMFSFGITHILVAPPLIDHCCRAAESSHRVRPGPLFGCCNSSRFIFFPSFRYVGC